MAMNGCLTLGLLIVVIACVSAQIPSRRRQKPKPKIPEMEQLCLDCICQASTNCDETLKCHNSGSGYFCGPFVISWAYWHDSGRPGERGLKHDFETCLNNKTCAEQAVRGYMKKHGQDCDGSGTIDCYDFSRIHKLGYGSCGASSVHDTDYWQKFEICYSGYPPEEDNSNANNDFNIGVQPQDYEYGDETIQARKSQHN